MRRREFDVEVREFTPGDPNAVGLFLLDAEPDDAGLRGLMRLALDNFDAGGSPVRTEVTTAAPGWLPVAERDQIDSALRDRPGVVVAAYLHGDEAA